MQQERTRFAAHRIVDRVDPSATLSSSLRDVWARARSERRFATRRVLEKNRSYRTTVRIGADFSLV